MDSKTSLTLGMATALTLGIVIIFASPLSASTNIGGSSCTLLCISAPCLSLAEVCLEILSRFNFRVNLLTYYDTAIN
jgi:hypothetical protein